MSTNFTDRIKRATHHVQPPSYFGTTEELLARFAAKLEQAKAAAPQGETSVWIQLNDSEFSNLSHPQLRAAASYMNHLLRKTTNTPMGDHKALRIEMPRDAKAIEITVPLDFPLNMKSMNALIQSDRNMLATSAPLPRATQKHVDSKALGELHHSPPCRSQEEGERYLALIQGTRTFHDHPKISIKEIYTPDKTAVHFLLPKGEWDRTLESEGLMSERDRPRAN